MGSLCNSYMALANQVAAQLWLSNLDAVQSPTMVVSDA